MWIWRGHGRSSDRARRCGAKMIGPPTNADYAFRFHHGLRLPRTLSQRWSVRRSRAIALVWTRNPLALHPRSPSHARQSFAAVAIDRPLVPTANHRHAVALLGSLVVALLIYLFAWKREDSPMRLILVGIGSVWC